MNPDNRMRIALSLLVPVALVSGAAHAQTQSREISFSLKAGGTWSDNVHRSTTEERSDTTAEVGFDLGVRREKGRLRSRVSADFQYRTFAEDTYDDELIGGLDGDFTYDFVPERFVWVVQDNFGQTFIDPRAVETPDNRQNTNYFTTGPDIRLSLTERTDLSIMARWSDARFQESFSDNQRLSGTLGLVRRISRRALWSLNGSAERIEYDDSILLSEFDRRSGYIGFQAEGAKTELSLQAGYSEIDILGDTRGSPLFNIAASRRLTARSNLTLNAGTSLTDTAEAFRRDQSLTGVLLGNELSVVSQDPFRSDYASLGWTFDGSRADLNIRAEWRRDEHEEQDEFNRNSWGASLGLSRRFSPTFTGSLSGSWRRENFEDSDVKFKEWVAGFGVTWNMGRSYALTLHGDHLEGSGGTSIGSGVRDFTENRVSVTVTFAPRR